MKISYNWLKRYAGFTLEPEDAGRLLTGCGLEVEDIERYQSVKGALRGVIIGQVVECTRHPNADKLSLTRVDIGGDRLLSIVCGAPNVAVGQKVPVATVGTVLYQGDKTLEIKEARIRGEFSEGMICAEDELGLGSSHDGIMVLDPAVKVGMPASEYFGVTEDYVFEIGLTPNRTDATSHTGVARDLVAVINRRSEGTTLKLSWPKVDDFKTDDHSLEIPVVVEDPEACPRYSGVTISGVQVGPSPAWLQHLLLAAGIRPINNVVDITNFVLMELGQPLHAFDAGRITGKKVVVRKARRDEPFVTLDEVKRTLTPDDLMICNAENGMCIAGVFGGAESGVTASTTDIFLESAHFNPRSIRKTSRYHGLQTDASFRFERGSDPSVTVYALKRAALLIKEIAGGKISSGIVDIYPRPIAPAQVTVTWAGVRRLIGKEIPHDVSKAIITDLGMDIVNEHDDGLVISVPPFKTDVLREADVIEEILRIYGYDYIEMPGQLRSSLSFAPKPDPEATRDLVSNLLASRGFFEIMNNSLTRSRYAEEHAFIRTEDNVTLLNPLSSDLGVMRQTLLFGGLETIAFNQNRKMADLKLFEFGRVYSMKNKQDDTDQPLGHYNESEHLAIWMSGRRNPENWRTEDASVDIYDLKDAVQAILSRLGFNLRDLHIEKLSDDLFQAALVLKSRTVELATMGIVRKNVLKNFDIRQDVMFARIDWMAVLAVLGTNKPEYREIPKFPEVRRDLALVLDPGVEYEDLRLAAFQAERQILRNVNLFDVYEGDKIAAGKKSYAMSFTLRDDEKTLNDHQIEKAMERILRAFTEKFGATVR